VPSPHAPVTPLWGAPAPRHACTPCVCLQVVAVGAGGNASYVLLSDGSVVSWGQSNFPKDISVPADVAQGSKKVVSLAVGCVLFCARV
jgi:alpha-tubulin suppressor-like RCC1 family protein